MQAPFENCYDRRSSMPFGRTVVCSKSPVGEQKCSHGAFYISSVLMFLYLLIW